MSMMRATQLHDFCRITNTSPCKICYKKGIELVEFHYMQTLIMLDMLVYNVVSIMVS